MPALTWLAKVLRDAGLNVQEISGWQNRGADGWSIGAMNPVGVIAHATVTRRTSGPAPGLDAIINGRVGLSGPIAQLHLARDGKYSVVAAGVANHAGSGGLWGYTGNQHVIGIEAENDNGMEGPNGTKKYPTAEPWPAVQYNAYVRGVAAILHHLGQPASRVGAHREWSSTGKSDPVGINMTTFRAHVAAAIAGNFEEDDMVEFTPEHARKLEEVHRILYEGRRLMDPPTAGGGVPIAWLPRVMKELGADVAESHAQLLAEVDGVEESGAQIYAAVQAIQAGDPDALADAIVAKLGPAQAQQLVAALGAAISNG